MMKQEMEKEMAMKDYYETEFPETVADMPEYPDEDAMDAEMAAIAEAEAAEMEEAEMEFEAARAEYEREAQHEAQQEETRQYREILNKFSAAGKYFDCIEASGA